MAPAPQVWYEEVPAPCQSLYEQVGAAQPCCPHDEEPSINYLRVQRYCQHCQELAAQSSAVVQDAGLSAYLFLPFPALKCLVVANSAECHLSRLHEQVGEQLMVG